MRSLLSIIVILTVAGAAAADEHKIIDRNGSTIGVVVDCNSCKDPKKGEKCQTGVQDGFLDGKPCGQCLLLSNFGTKLLYPHDLYLTGTLNQPDGSPLVNEFVRLYLPNTWTVRTRTTEKGYYRLVLGATEPREGDPMSIDLGTRSRPKKEGAADYALFMLPENYKPCSQD